MDPKDCNKVMVALYYILVFETEKMKLEYKTASHDDKYYAVVAVDNKVTC